MAKASEYLKEALYWVFWLALFEATLMLFYSGAAFVVHGFYGVHSHVILGFPRLGIHSFDGPAAVADGWRMIAGGLVMLALSVLAGRTTIRLSDSKAKAVENEKVHAREFPDKIAT